jgi:hypothetical protein
LQYIDERILCFYFSQGCFPGDPECSVTKQTSAINITTRDLSDDDPNDPKSYVLRLVAQSAGTHEIWKGYVLDDIVVNRQISFFLNPFYIQGVS